MYTAQVRAMPVGADCHYRRVPREVGRLNSNVLHIERVHRQQAARCASLHRLRTRPENCPPRLLARTCFRMRVSETRRRRLESSLAHRISRYDVVSASNPLSSSMRFCKAVTSLIYLTSERTWVSLKDCGRGQSSSSRRHSLMVPLVPPTRIGPPMRNMMATVLTQAHRFVEWQVVYIKKKKPNGMAGGRRK